MRHQFLVGDFNFVEEEDDSTSPILLTKTLQKTWEELLQSLRLREIHQPEHTSWRFDMLNERVGSSRLDRIYASYDEADLTVVSPVAHLPVDGARIIRSRMRAAQARHKLARGTPLTSGSPDHTPLRLGYATNEQRTRAKSLPRWLFQCPAFLEIFTSTWRCVGTSFGAWDRFERHVYKSAKTFLALFAASVFG